MTAGGPPASRGDGLACAAAHRTSAGRRRRGGSCGGAAAAAAARAVLLAWLLAAGAAAAPVRRAGSPAPPPPTHRPARADACPGESVAYKVNVSDRIFEGKVQSMSPAENGMYNVTFGVKKVHKGDRAELENKFVRLQFMAPPARGGGGGGGGPARGCRGEGNVVRANLKMSRGYLVFVERLGPHHFRPRAEPLPRSKATVHAVKEAVTCGVLRLEVQNATVRARSRLKLQCAVRPAPGFSGKLDRSGLSIAWYKDGTRLEHGDRFRMKKKRLTLPSVRLEDGGEYECRAERGRCRYEARATVQVMPAPVVEPPPPTLTPPLPGSLCPIDSYCLNGGSCTFFETIRELSCVCAEGYKGERCALKDVSNSGSMYKPYICKLGLFVSYYC